MSTIRERLCAEFEITPEEYGSANIDASDAVRFAEREVLRRAIEELRWAHAEHVGRCPCAFNDDAHCPENNRHAAYRADLAELETK